MTSLLLALTILSLIAAAGAGWYAWRLRHEERRRSDARVAALSAAIDMTTGAPATGPAQAPVPVSSLFSLERSAAARGTPVIKVAVGVAMALALLIVVAMSDRGATSDTTGASAAPRAAAARGQAQLELLSMRHEREGQTLRVQGLVRNPRGAGEVSRVTAVVLVFNRAGAYVASGRAALDFTTLEPGDESPFVVTMPGVSEVARYRVSFRTEAGVVRHVDRRAEQMRLASTR